MDNYINVLADEAIEQLKVADSVNFEDIVGGLIGRGDLPETVPSVEDFDAVVSVIGMTVNVVADDVSGEISLAD